MVPVPCLHTRLVGVEPSLPTPESSPRASAKALALFCILFLMQGTAAQAAQPADGGFSEALSSGPLYAGLAAFVSGILVSFTPCVYPMVAITVSVFGARNVQSRAQGLLLSAAFVGGIVSIFVPLGVVAGLTGGVLGSLLSSSWVMLGLSALFIWLAASMFGAFELDLPSSVKNRLARAGGSGFWGALVLGMICGPIAAPCTGPFLTGILAWITKTQSAWYGAALMAAFALGLGLPFFLVGAFALQLPKSGRWMLFIKSFLGLVLIVVALYFLSSAYPALTTYARGGVPFRLACIAAVAAGLALGAIHLSFEGSSPGVRVRKALAIALTSAGAFLMLMSWMKPEHSLAWESASIELAEGPLTIAARLKAREESRPLLVDFTAAWCIACKEMDKETFADHRVRQEAGRFVALRVDLTNDDDPRVKATTDEHAVSGLPTVILFGSDGVEARRFNRKVSADEFVEALQRVN